MLRHADSFDFYATAQLTLLYGASTGTIAISAGNGRNGTAALSLGGGAYVRKNFDAQATWIVAEGATFSAIASADAILLAFFDSGTTQVDLRVTPTGELRVTRAGTSLGVTSGLGLVSGVWYHIGFKAVINNTTGSFEVWVNGVSKLSGSGLDTQNTANASANQVHIQSGLPAGTTYVDDLYVLDGQAGLNSFQGDLKVTALFPSAAGDRTEWTPSAGANWQNVDEAAPDSDTTYNSSSTAAQADLYAMGDITGSPTIKAVDVLLFVRKDDAGSRTVETRIKTNTVEYGGADVSVGDTYAYVCRTLYENNPQSGVAWTVAEVNALQAGMNLIS